VDDEVKLVFTEPYPNPFASDLYYGLKLSGNEDAHDFIFEVRDLSGRNLFRHDVASVIPVGNHEFLWSGTDNNGNLLSAGVYLITYRVTLGGIEYQYQAKVVFH
jgi:flagellar hook assembly protein FlgD